MELKKTLTAKIMMEGDDNGWRFFVHIFWLLSLELKTLKEWLLISLMRSFVWPAHEHELKSANTSVINACVHKWGKGWGSRLLTTGPQRYCNLGLHVFYMILKILSQLRIPFVLMSTKFHQCDLFARVKRKKNKKKKKKEQRNWREVAL